mmetsp:Transcript_437/g.862  ORF Transcript_437/g.862 Transcript_437/m.862 type:complete len:449 (-) Transcript_437:24-1370(-)
MPPFVRPSFHSSLNPRKQTKMCHPDATASHPATACSHRQPLPTGTTDSVEGEEAIDASREMERFPNRSVNGHSPVSSMVIPEAATRRKLIGLSVKEWTGLFDSLPRTRQFVFLTMGMFLFFGAHNVLQEAMMKVEGFHYGVMLGYMEVLGVTVCSYLERTYVAKETKRVAPLRLYPLLTLCLLSSSGLSNMSLNYINFPTKVVFRSCKLVPTMLIATIMNRKVFSSLEYMCALSICVGLILFSVADWTLAPTFNPIGLVMVFLSVCADAILPNAQERLFGMGASRLEVTYFTNVITLACMTVMTLASGDLVAIIKLAMVNHQLALYMSIYTAVSYVAISAYMNLVKRFGGVAAVYIATARKAMTLVLSFLLFPKDFSWFYVAGATLVLGGLMVVSLYKQKRGKMQEAAKADLNQALGGGSELEALKDGVEPITERDLEAASHHDVSKR